MDTSSISAGNDDEAFAPLIDHHKGDFKDAKWSANIVLPFLIVAYRLYMYKVFAACTLLVITYMNYFDY